MNLKKEIPFFDYPHVYGQYKEELLPEILRVLESGAFILQKDVFDFENAVKEEEEKHLLDVRPGITDPSSIVFSDEGDIIAGSDGPDLRYNQVIRPWKSRLALILLTVVSIFSRPLALQGLQKVLKKLGADDRLLAVARREEPLRPYPPPGSSEIVTSR